ncbi:DUF4190 domain-containing protein [[Actinomadura] parvosata]|uniref:DUF4190 domain-containing protein n=1 Tax=[Actinomadura] parvosata TaxID=1955412 RepID=UPI00406D39C7
MERPTSTVHDQETRMGYPQQPYDPPGQMYGQPQRRTNGLSVAALVLGLTGFITCGFTSILAVIFGHVALTQIRRDGTDGRGMAVGGLVLGWVLTGLWLLFWALSWTGVISSFLYTAAAVSSLPPAERTRLDVGVQPGGGEHRVVLEAVGRDGATSAGNVTWSRDFSIKQERGVPLPYTKELAFDGELPRLYLWVQNAGADGVVECRIKVDGRVVREAEAAGPYGVCTVTADAP